MIRWMQTHLAAVLAIALALSGTWDGTAAVAQSPGAADLGALARVAGPMSVQAGWRSLSLDLPLTQPVPWRTRLMADPPRAVVDFRSVDWAGFDVGTVTLAGNARALRTGIAGGGWSRLVIELSRPMGFAEAAMVTDPETGAARLTLSLRNLDDAAFARQAEALAGADPEPDPDALAGAAAPAPLGARPTIVVLDPGHGGVDPGASYRGLTEAQIMLTFARELTAALRRTGRYDVVMTRDSDRFVSLESRITVAHSANADLFLSLHADALDGRQARGATLYTLADEATDAASAALAERHDRDDLLGGGVDLTGADDAVASVLMSLARARSTPATERLARSLVTAIQARDLRMHRDPWQQAAFSVLKSPSVPSVLLEVGFLSNEPDRNRLRDRRWRATMIQAVVNGLDGWVAGEAALIDRR